MADPAEAGLPYLQELLPKQSAAAEPALKLEAHTAIMLQRSVYDALRDLKVRCPSHYDLCVLRSNLQISGAR